ncbi:hypothetical protein NY08_3785 [Rhodococcus sp. B7740]|nr:hypothetical protein NY08_3785 [Rhodococcus sp. B7740]
MVARSDKWGEARGLPSGRRQGFQRDTPADYSPPVSCVR